ncbi:MAG: TOBE domain-containing protein [Candidatus Competibacteraceae bacterium]|nr:TOBE domain-containing protein [Candidatus Competibacteraceae bacterium]
MKTSVRNQYHDRVKSLAKEAVNAGVVLELDDHNQVVAVITNTSVERLNLSQGSEARALMKASSVILAVA